MNDIPSILKKAIQEKGYTQEQFADITGIPLPTLKDYLSGKTKYDYEALLTFAEKLDCSVDYLMGLSKSQVREHREIAEVIGLSDKAIDVLEENKNNRLFNELLGEILVDKQLLNDICLFIGATKPVNEGIKEVSMLMGERLASECEQGDFLPNQYILSMEKQYMISIVMDIGNLKEKLSKDLTERICKQIGMSEKEAYSKIASMLKFPNGGQ